MRSDTVTIENSSVTEMAEEEKERKKRKEKPPEDDCCPICFEDFSVACMTNCGHWFCGNCILQLWRYRGALRACKCPICTCSITQLAPEASLLFQQEKDIVDLLKGIHCYNRLYVGGMRGIVLKTPLLLRSVLWTLMDILLDPHQLRLNYNMMRVVALLVGWIYSKCHFDFIPTGRLGIYAVLDTCAVILVIVLFYIGLYRKWIRGRRIGFAVEQQAIRI
ncbi:unnamed protein product [Cuscuta epithymum]|uniref:RING-type domain-containing protein n=1 Tax=Cuscuta epithymum TaxID=186058 RepID=A0AAV0EQU6_9ASTE|nr:unnamed protein product [Cuscuta epithymum]CAH9125601.1 unnamed protein product [Cuscuta epithymum]